MVFALLGVRDAGEQPYPDESGSELRGHTHSVQGGLLLAWASVQDLRDPCMGGYASLGLADVEVDIWDRGGFSPVKTDHRGGQGRVAESAT